MTSTLSSQTPVTPKRAQKMASSQNLNHLLNFTLPPRQVHPVGHLPRRGKRTSSNQGVWNKERFVNAQYRFVMNPTGDYTVHFADPDIFFQWHDILQIIVPRRSALASTASAEVQQEHDDGNTICPICLSTPTAPRMTKCGHVFCFPCILHYLSLSDNKWARCPICFDSVNERQLKNVKWYDGQNQPDTPQTSEASSSQSDDYVFNLLPQCGSTMCMRLMQRPQITTLALPRSKFWPSDLLPPHKAPFHFLPDVFSFAKFMLATPEYLLTDLSKDLDELATERRILEGMDDTLGISFVEGADQKVRHQMEFAAGLGTPALKAQVDNASKDQRDIEKRLAYHQRGFTMGQQEQVNYSGIPNEYVALKPSGSTSVPAPLYGASPTSKAGAGVNRNTLKQRKNVNPPDPSTSTYYFYQAASGLPIFLHPLDIKILLAHFKSYPSFPDTVTIRVESFAEGSVNDDLRKRCKYLAHMPEGTDVVFVEADLSDVVGTEGIKNFEGALKARTSRRKEKERKDDRARIRAEERDREREMPHLSSPWSDLRSPSVTPISVTPEHVESEESAPVSSPTSGAWGARSFASALHSTPNRSNNVQQRHEELDEWDVDAAWHGLERNTGRRKKRGTRLVVLGSGGGGGRRR